MRCPRWWSAAVLLGLVLCPSAHATAQLDPASQEHPLHGLAFLEGSWTGRIDGTIGSNTGQREYRFIIGDRFLLMMHDRDPQEHAPPGDTHEEWSIFSGDAVRGVIVLREFLIEGLVNTYTCELDAGPTKLTCEGEATEGGERLFLKLRYEFVDLDHFTETFEVFGPDGAMQVRIEGQWLRKGVRN